MYVKYSVDFSSFYPHQAVLVGFSLTKLTSSLIGRPDWKFFVWKCVCDARFVTYFLCSIFAAQTEVTLAKLSPAKTPWRIDKYWQSPLQPTRFWTAASARISNHATRKLNVINWNTSSPTKYIYFIGIETVQ